MLTIASDAELNVIRHPTNVRLPQIDLDSNSYARDVAADKTTIWLGLSQSEAATSLGRSLRHFRRHFQRHV